MTDNIDDLKEKERLLHSFRISLAVHWKSFIAAIIILNVLTLLGLFAPNFIPLSNALLLGLAIDALILIRVWYLYSKSMVLITNIRVIYVAQRKIFSKETNETYFENVANIGTKVNGFMQSIFNFGDVLVQTEAENWLKNVTHPSEVKDSLFDALHKHKHKGIEALPKKFWGKRRQDEEGE